MKLLARLAPIIPRPQPTTLERWARPQTGPTYLDNNGFWLITPTGKEEFRKHWPDFRQIQGRIDYTLLLDSPDDITTHGIHLLRLLRRIQRTTFLESDDIIHGL